jgi:hypothetical protein
MNITRFFIVIVGGLVVLVCNLASSSGVAVPSKSAAGIDVRIITDEADSVLAILTKHKYGTTIADSDWNRLFSSEGYVRLKKREASMDRAFTDDDFKSFVLSESLVERTESLSKTLSEWKRVSVEGAARRALAYLPDGAQIKAKIYPVIKPRENSFVFDVSTDPAIFLYLDPSTTRDQFENTLAHELHHIGYGSGCSSKAVENQTAKLPKNARSVIEWTGAFGEGFAMLAAAGGPDIHPHTVSKPEDRSRWDRELANMKQDLQALEQFFFDLLKGTMAEEEQRTRGYSFFGVQGPWYTIGWKMSVTIEKGLGRDALIQIMCDRRRLLSTYNAAAERQNRTGGEPLPLWSSALIDAVEGGTR